MRTISETLLGRVTQWKPTGCIAYKHSNGVAVELTRFRFPMTFDDENVAKCFGLEIARLLLDSSDQEFVTARYESENRLVARCNDADENGLLPLENSCRPAFCVYLTNRTDRGQRRGLQYC
jgi:hypothetical protein